jgi:hypothetical protein
LYGPGRGAGIAPGPRRPWVRFDGAGGVGRACLMVLTAQPKGILCWDLDVDTIGLTDWVPRHWLGHIGQSDVTTGRV